MSFIADKQTLQDLNLLGRFRSDSVFSLFNRTETTGGMHLLDKMFRAPMTTWVEINERSRAFKYFGQRGLSFPFTKEQIKLAEDYLGGSGSANLLLSLVGAGRKKVLAVVLRDQAYGLMTDGIYAVILMLTGCKDLLNRIEKNAFGTDSDIPFYRELQDARELVAHPSLKEMLKEQREEGLALWKVAKYDHLLRRVFAKRLRRLLDLIYQLDVYISVSAIAVSRGFNYARALPKDIDILYIDHLRHPAIENGIGNSLSFSSDSNMLFLTGANMAGKSTLMKALGISVYLAHMGFPLPAAAMSLSVRDGIYSSINMSDNLALGYSHFYAEVLRVKAVAEAVSTKQHLLVLFDELFKGTNVRDAYDATLAVTEALAGYRNCQFVISTHIIEVGTALRESYRNIQFAYLPTVMTGRTASYPYRLEGGVTSDRHGMMIIRKEKIIEMILS